VARILIQEAASWRLDEIHRHTRDRWGTAQADHYIAGPFESFDGSFGGHAGSVSQLYTQHVGGTAHILHMIEFTNIFESNVTFEYTNIRAARRRI
jgi:plasmid stabilization system protein ParE